MKLHNRVLPILAATFLLFSASEASAVLTGDKFQRFLSLIDDAGLVYEELPGYEPKEVAYNELFQYEHVLQHQSGNLEIRYAIRPLSQIIIDYQDPHSATPEPNHIYPLMFSAITDRLSGAKHSPSNEYSSEQANELFNADWAAVSVFDTQDEFSAQFSQGTLLAMHGNKKADAYLVFLFNDYSAVKESINSALATLRFAASDRVGNSASADISAND